MKKKIFERERERERERDNFYFYFYFLVWEIYAQNVSEWKIHSKMMGITRAKKKGRWRGKIICKVKTA